MVTSSLDKVSKDGGYARPEAGFTNEISAAGPFMPEKNRYHLFVSLACPWAAGALTVLRMKGLERVISHSVVHPTWQRTKPEDLKDEHTGWVFRKPGDAPLIPLSGHGSIACDDALIPDTVNGCKTLREVYEKAGDTQGLYSTPLLFDTKTNKIVSNESLVILRSLNDAFQEFAANPGLDLFPAELEGAMMKLNTEIIYPKINNGVYRCGFARSQEAYDTAYRELYEALEQCEGILGRQRYILSAGKVTALDIRLFHTLIRFDSVYHTYFKTNGKRIKDYPNLFNYTKDIYQLPHVSSAVNMAHIKTHYFTSHPTLNTYAIIPVGTDVDYSESHDRASLPQQVPTALRRFCEFITYGYRHSHWHEYNTHQQGYNTYM